MLNIRHQRKHFLRGIPDQDGFMDGFHESIGSANTMHQDGTVCESRIGDQVPIVGKAFFHHLTTPTRHPATYGQETRHYPPASPTNRRPTIFFEERHEAGNGAARLGG